MKNRNPAPDQAFKGYRVLLEFGEAVLLESPEGKLVLIDAGDDEEEARLCEVAFIRGTRA